jgi:membrane protease YdiL (CAAX protease family)
VEHSWIVETSSTGESNERAIAWQLAERACMNESPLDASTPSAADRPAETVASPGQHNPAARPPRIWTVFAVYLLAFAATLGVQIVLTIALLLWLLLQGATLQEAPNRLLLVAGTPEFFIGVGIPAQLMLLLTALAAAWFSPVPLRQRLGMQLPRGGLVWIAVWLVGAAVPFLLGIGAAMLLARVIPPDPGVQQLYKNMHWQIALPFIVFIAFVPGLSEELLFRGYIQRRLTERWPAWVGILVTSLLFAVMHIMPHAMVLAFLLGIWLGLMAWRCDSVWPGVICHALINGLWNVWQIGLSLKVFSEQAELPLLIAGGGVGLVAFALACWDLATVRRFEPP